MMKAQILDRNVNGMNLTHREREERAGLMQGYKALCLDGDKLVELVDLRIGKTPGRVYYACAWLYQPRQYSADRKGMNSRGSGKASGYGEHLGSAAASDALAAAGLQFDKRVSGSGWGAVREAVEAAGRALVGAKVPVYIVESYA